MTSTRNSRWLLRTAAWIFVWAAVFAFLADAAHVHHSGTSEARCTYCAASHQSPAPVRALQLVRVSVCVADAGIPQIIGIEHQVAIEKVTRPPPALV